MRTSHRKSSSIILPIFLAACLSAFSLDALAQEQGPATTGAPAAGQGGQAPVHMGQPITYWIEMLRSQDQMARQTAYTALTSVGEEAVPYVAELLKDPDQQVRALALTPLGIAAGKSDVALKAVLGALKDDSGSVRGQALSQLSRLGWDEDVRLKSTVPLLLEAMESGDPDIRRNVAGILGRMGPEYIPHIIRVLDDRDSMTVSSAAMTIGNLGKVASEATPALLKALGPVEDHQRGAIIRALGSIGPKAREAIPVLLKMLDNSRDQSQVMRALVKIGPDDPRVLEALVGRLKNSYTDSADTIVKIGPAAAPYVLRLMEGGTPNGVSAGSRVLVKIQPLAAEVVPPILEALRRLKKREGLVIDVAGALGSLGASAAPLLVEALKDPDPDIRAAAAGGLKKMGADARVALPALLQALNDKNTYVVAWSVEALGNIGAEAKEAVPELIRLLHPVQEYPRRAAAEALGKMGPDAKAAIPALLEALEDKDLYLPFNAARALVKIGADPGPAIPVLVRESGRFDEARHIVAGLGAAAVPELVRALDAPKDEMRFNAARTLMEMGPPAKDAVPALMAAMEKGDGNVKGFAIQALGAIGPDARSTVLAIAQVLQRGDVFMQGHAAEALGRIGPDAAETMPALLDLCRSSNPITLQKAAEALGRMGPKGVEVAPKLIELLRSDWLGDTVVLTVGGSLGKLGKHPGFPLEKLREGLGSDQGSLKLGSAVALHLIDPQDEAALEVLVEACVRGRGRSLSGDPLGPKLAALGFDKVIERAVQRLAGGIREKHDYIITIGMLGPLAKAAVPALIEAWPSATLMVRRQCLLAWRDIGPDASEAIPLIREALTDWRVDVRGAAFDALNKIDPRETAHMLPPY